MTGTAGEVVPVVYAEPVPAGVRQQATAASGATVVQVGGDLYVSDETLTAFWQPTETTPLECPYPGLEAFGLAQAKWFFGRERVTADLIDLLDRALRRGNGGPVVVVGPSGAGKSSLLGAGLLKALRDGRLPVSGSADWPVLKLTPGATPMRTLATAAYQCAAAIRGLDPSAAASPAWDLTWDEALAQLRDAIGGARGLGRGAGDPADRRVLVVADQLEELFTAGSDEAEIASFLDALSAVAAPGPGGPLGVVAVGMRADFYARATEYPVLRSALQSAQLVIGAMSPAEITEAVTRPARVTGLRLDAGLTERLLRDLGAESDGTGYEAGRLPLLAYALRATWQRRGGNRLTIAAYEQTGGIGGAIAKAAEDVYAGLSDDQQRIARQLLLALVHVGSAEAGAEGIPDTRRRVTRAHLCASTSDPRAAAAVLDAFTAARLVTSGDTAVEITHDALLTRWPRLREWIGQDRSGNLIHQSLEEAAVTWDDEGRDTSALYSGVRLAAAREWAEDPARPRELSAVARAFLAASDRRRRAAARRRNGIIAILAVLSIGLAAAAGYARVQQVNAENFSRQQSGAIFAAQANQAFSVNDPGAGMEFVVEAQRLNPNWIETGNDLLDVQSNAFTGRLSSNSPVFGEAYSPDGTILATGSMDGTLRLWDTATRQQVTSLRPDNGRKITMIAFSPSGDFFAADEPGGVRLWHVSGHRLTDPVVLPVRSEPVGIAFSPDSTMLAIGDNDGGVSLVSLATDRPLTVLDAAPASQSTAQQSSPGLPQSEVEAVAFTPDGQTMVTATYSGVVRIWNVARAALIATLPVTDAFGHLALSHNGQVIAVDSQTGTTDTLELWSLASRTLKATVSYGVEGIDALAFSPDGSILAAGSTSGIVRLWDVARTPAPLVANLTGHTDQVNQLAFSPDGALLASADLDGTVGLWSVLENTVDGYNDPAGTLTFNPRATELAVAAAPGGKVGVTLYAMPGRRAVASLVSAVPNAKWISALAFSPDGRTLAVATNDPEGTVQLWDTTTHQITGTFQTHNVPYVQAVAFSPDGSLLATTGYADPVIRLWNPATQRPAGTLTGNSGYEGFAGAAPGAWSLAFSPDGTRLAAADSDSVVRIWRIPSTGAAPVQLAPPATAVGSDAAPVQGIAYTRNGAYLAAGYGNGDVVVWRSSCLSCAPLAIMHSDNEAITDIGFTADGRSLVTASQDGEVRLWPVGTWTTPETLSGSGQSVSATVSPVGTLIATADGNAVRVWDTDQAREAALLCQTLKVPAPPAAWKQYGLTQYPYTPIC